MERNKEIEEQMYLTSLEEFLDKKLSLLKDRDNNPLSRLDYNLLSTLMGISDAVDYIEHERGEEDALLYIEQVNENTMFNTDDFDN